MGESALFSCRDAVSAADCAWMTSHRMKNGPDTTKLYEAAELRLYDYLLPSQTATDDGLPTVVRDAIFDVINGKRKTYRYMMFVGLLVAITDKSLHPRCLQLQSGCDGAYDPCSLCKDVVSPFEKTMLKGRLGGSCDPYVSNPARHPMIEKTNKVKSSSDKIILGKLYDVLEFVRTAEDAMRKKMFCYAYGLVLNRPPTESSLVDFDVSVGSDVSADKFFDFLEAHTQGVSAVVTLAAYFRTCCGKVKSAVVHPITESGASPKEVGDIDLMLKDGCPVAVEVKDKPYKDVDVQHVCEKALKAGVHHVIFAFGPEAEKKRPQDGVLRNYWKEKGVQLACLSISSELCMAITLSDETKRCAFANDMGKALVEMNAPHDVIEVFKKTFKKDAA